ncbi:hypothetical protein Scep_028637 [Stephania cephalantha]|uniref:Uncharacterized protein n=1 Tax=Stephania cephalantha TaxID=152367 RepID=A0AAP0ECE4_9MAGN
MQLVAGWERPNIYICLIHFTKSNKRFTLVVNQSQPSPIFFFFWVNSLPPFSAIAK